MNQTENIYFSKAGNKYLSKYLLQNEQNEEKDIWKSSQMQVLSL